MQLAAALRGLRAPGIDLITTAELRVLPGLLHTFALLPGRPGRSGGDAERAAAENLMLHRRGILRLRCDQHP